MSVSPESSAVDTEAYTQRVWVATGTKYHESLACATRGDDHAPVPVFRGFAVDAGLEPCGTCAVSYEAEGEGGGQ